jgi:hypothetical protein
VLLIYHTTTVKINRHGVEPTSRPFVLSLCLQGTHRLANRFERKSLQGTEPIARQMVLYIDRGAIKRPPNGKVSTMTRHQRRKAKVVRDAAKLDNLIQAAIADRNARILARNVGAMRNGVLFETSGALAPRAYKHEGASSEAARVGSNIAKSKEVSMNDRATEKYAAKVGTKA